MKTLAISNQKGGVAKTTTALTLAAALAEQGHRVLAVDMDPQGNLTLGLGHEPDTLEKGMVQVLLGEIAPQEAILRAERAGIDLLPTDLTLAGAEKRLYGEIGFDELLKQRLRTLQESQPIPYDYVVVDSPPSLGLLTVNALTAADMVIVPVQCEYFSTRGLAQLLEIVSTIQKRRNPSLEVRVLPSLYDSRVRICKDILDQLKESFVGEIFETTIGIDARIRESQAAGEPITTYAPTSRAAVQYRALASEITGETPAATPKKKARPKKRAGSTTRKRRPKSTKSVGTARSRAPRRSASGERRRQDRPLSARARPNGNTQ
jgi:chromosome partitioning protein